MTITKLRSRRLVDTVEGDQLQNPQEPPPRRPTHFTGNPNVEVPPHTPLAAAQEAGRIWGKTALEERSKTENPKETKRKVGELHEEETRYQKAQRQTKKRRKRAKETGGKGSPLETSENFTAEETARGPIGPERSTTP